jgi:hypothetical protein
MLVYVVARPSGGQTLGTNEGQKEPACFFDAHRERGGARCAGFLGRRARGMVLVRAASCASASGASARLATRLEGRNLVHLVLLHSSGLAAPRRCQAPFESRNGSRVRLGSPRNRRLSCRGQRLRNAGGLRVDRSPGCIRCGRIQKAAQPRSAPVHLPQVGPRVYVEGGAEQTTLNRAASNEANSGTAREG